MIFILERNVIYFKECGSAVYWEIIPPYIVAHLKCWVFKSKIKKMCTVVVTLIKRTVSMVAAKKEVDVSSLLSVEILIILSDC